MLWGVPVCLCCLLLCKCSSFVTQSCCPKVQPVTKILTKCFKHLLLQVFDSAHWQALTSLWKIKCNAHSSCFSTGIYWLTIKCRHDEETLCKRHCFDFFFIVSWSTCCSSSDRGWATDALIEWNRWRRRKKHLSTNGSCWKTPHRTTTWRSACKFLIVFLEFDVVLIFVHTRTLYFFLCVFSVLEDESTRLSAVELKYFIITGLKSLYGEVRPWRPVRS